MRIIPLLVSGEFYFAAFLLAGYFKGGISGVPVDLTLLFFGLSVLVSVKRLLQRPTLLRSSFFPTSLYLLLLTIIVISFWNSESIVYAQDKLLRFILITTWAFLGVFFLLKTDKSIHRFFMSIALISSVIGCLAIMELITSILEGRYNGTIFIMNTDYLGVGRSVGLGLVILLCYKWFAKETYSRWVSIFVVIMLCVILFGGGKMPLIATLVSLFVTMIISTRITRNSVVINVGTKKILRIVISFVLLSIPANATGLFETVFRRLNSMLSGADQSSLERVYLYQTAFDMIKNNFFFGAGWATFPLYYIGEDKKIYPHNIFLEIFAELGILGLIVFTLLMIFSVAKGYFVFKMKHGTFDAIQYTVIAATVFFFFNANTSGDITDNKILFTFLAVMCISPYIQRSDHTHIKDDSAKNSVPIKPKQINSNSLVYQQILPKDSR